MQLFFSEYQADYTTYTFAYAIYGVQENPGELPDMYARGFLPYTGDPTLSGDIFYLARSVRVNLPDFEESSENRRIARKAESLGITLTVIEKSTFDADNPVFLEFCTQYAQERFSGGTMDTARLRYVISRSSCSHILSFSSGSKTLGYGLACITPEMLHYWYAFFDVAYLRSYSLGKWMMWRTIRWAKDQGLQYAYLGTCYGSKALYKVRDHRGCEFFNGIAWDRDAEHLKRLCRQDDADSSGAYDEFKAPDPVNRERFRQFLRHV